MFWNRNAAHITNAWEAEIAVKQETGAIPLLTTGAPSGALPAIPALSATHALTTRRQDITIPLLPVGGSSPVWLGHLLAPQPRPDALRDPEPWSSDPTVLFAGADPVTVQATLAALAADVAAPAQGETVPAHVAVEMAPRLVPGAAVGWETLPFLEVGERYPAGDDLPELQPETSVDWSGWGAILLALCLVLSAVLI